LDENPCGLRPRRTWCRMLPIFLVKQRSWF
jgi:hypothetical protein